MEHHFPEITKAERDYFGELEELRMRVSLMPERLGRVKNLLKQDVRSLDQKEAAGSSGELGDSQVGNIQKTLESTSVFFLFFVLFFLILLLTDPLAFLPSATET